MKEVGSEWFETGEFAGRTARHVSKFLRRDFNVPVKVVEERWPSWTAEERLIFAGAFSARFPHSDNDQRILDFLMQSGDTRIWRKIALPVARHRDRSCALRFLLARIAEAAPPLSNYYQAIQTLSASECVPALLDALSRHRQEVELHPSVQTSTEKLIYSDYLYCSATLFKITGQEVYRANITRMLEHGEEVVRQRATFIARSAGIAV
ncbi:MAG: hypothetical protein WBF04_15500 [Candidatus Sulfotelmatobacter sp.]